MGRGCVILGWLIFTVATVNLVRNHGTQWEFGPLGLPRSLLRADGRAYADGTPITPLMAWFARSGAEELLGAGLIILLPFLARSAWVLHRRRKELERILLHSRNSGGGYGHARRLG